MQGKKELLREFLLIASCNWLQKGGVLMSSFNYNVSISGLSAAQYLMKISQNNIANANTDGYVKEEGVLKPQDSVQGGGTAGQIGSGVSIYGVQRVTDNSLTQQVRDDTTFLTYNQTLGNGMSNIQNIVGELQDGSLSNDMQDFFNSFEDLSGFPNQSSYRAAVIGKAQLLTNKFNAMSSQLMDLKSQTDNSINVNIQDANNIIKQLAEINKEIKETTTEKPNALLDKRDSLLNDLSKYGNVQVVQNPSDASLQDIEFGGTLVVSGTVANQIKGMYDQKNDSWILSAGDVALNLKSGSLQAYLEIRNKEVPDNLNEIDNLASTIIAQVNTLHSGAYDLNGNTGTNFFTGTNANDIKVNTAIVNNPNLIAVSSVLGETGNGDVAKQIANLQSSNIMASGDTPIQDWTAFTVSKGQKLNMVQNNATVYQNVLNSTQEQLQSVQGVSTDEEMANLMQYQNFYQANAKAIQAIDKSYQDLLNIIS